MYRLAHMTFEAKAALMAEPFTAAPGTALANFDASNMWDCKDGCWHGVPWTVVARQVLPGTLVKAMIDGSIAAYETGDRWTNRTWFVLDHGENDPDQRLIAATYDGEGADGQMLVIRRMHDNSVIDAA